jgi:hypothetical protein
MTKITIRMAARIPPPQTTRRRLISVVLSELQRSALCYRPPRALFVGHICPPGLSSFSLIYYDHRRKAHAGTPSEISLFLSRLFRLGVGFNRTGGAFCVNFATTRGWDWQFYGWDSREKTVSGPLRSNKPADAEIRSVPGCNRGLKFAKQGACGCSA